MTTKTRLLITLPFLLTACQSVESFLSDSGVRQNTSTAVVVNKVPRTAVGDENVSKSKGPAAPAAAPSAITSIPGSTQAQTPAAANGQNVVPNVAPSLGE